MTTNAPRSAMASTRALAGPDGADLHVHDLGGTGPALLMVHATGLHGAVWAPVAGHLSDWHCVAIDLRGHGDSPLPAGDDLHWDGFGRDVAAVAERLDAPVVGVGHSLGAVALLMAAAESPSRFSVLVLYEPAMRMEGGDLPADLVALQDATVAVANARRSRFASRALAMATFAAKPPFARVQAAALHAYVQHGFAETDRGDVVLKCSPAVEAGVFARTHDHDLLARLGRVSCPVFVVRGDESSPEQARSSDAMGQALGRQRLVLDGADHFGPLAQPSRFAALVRRAVGSVGLA